MSLLKTESPRDLGGIGTFINYDEPGSSIASIDNVMSEYTMMYKLMWV